MFKAMKNTFFLAASVLFDANQNIERHHFVALLALIICVFAPAQLRAQVTAGTLSGRITSTDGARIANARVAIKNMGNGDTKIVATKDDGSFSVSSLPAGIFEITVSAPGFADARTNVTMTAGKDSRADILMHTESGSGADKSRTSGLSGVVTSKSVTDLPLNGRSASDLAALEPGVATARTQSTGQAQRGFGTQMTISGGRPRQNDAQLDGISVNDYSNGPPASALGVSLGSDAVEQFSVLTSNYPAQYGRSSGGIIGASTRSGTNSFHGSAFEYIRNSAFDALPNGPLLGAGDTGVFTFAGQTVTPENYFTTKVDHKFSEQDALSGTYMFDKGNLRQPDELNDKRTGYDSQRQFAAVHETHTFSPQLRNSFRFGVNRVVAITGRNFPSGISHVADPSFGAVPGKNAPAIIVPGLTFFSGGLGTPSNFSFHWTSIQAGDDIARTKGAHSIKFGANLERMRDNILAVSDPGGEFSFNLLSDFLTNAPFSLSAAIPSAISERGFRQTVVGGYVQDDWRFRPNLTINLGLRYETATVPTEVHGHLTVLRSLTAAAPHLGDPLFFNPTLRNFEPRVGFSLNPFRDGKTILSAGFGVFDVLPLPYLIQFNELFSAPFDQHASVTN